MVTATAALAGCALVAACGSSGARQDAAEKKVDGNYPVQITAASFPTAQVLSQHVRMTIAIRNAGNKTIPNIAVTVCPVTCRYPAAPGQGTSSAVFDTNLGQDSLDNPSPPLWVVDRPPERGGGCGWSCRQGGGGGSQTSYPNTWAMGALKPGATATFTWGVTAVSPGRHIVAWQVAAGLNGDAHAVLAGGGAPQGRFVVEVSNRAAQSYVDNSGKIVTTP